MICLNYYNFRDLLYLAVTIADLKVKFLRSKKIDSMDSRNVVISKCLDT